MPNNPSLKELIVQTDGGAALAPAAAPQQVPAQGTQRGGLLDIIAPEKSYGIPLFDLIGKIANQPDQAQAARDSTAQKKQLIQGIAADVQGRDYEAAASKIMQLDPEKASTLITQMDKINPGFAAKMNFAQEGGKTAAQTEYGANARQLQDARLAAEASMKDKELEAAKSKPNREDEINKRFNISTIRQYQKDFNSSIKAVDEQLNSLGGLAEFTKIAETNPMAAAQLGVKVAKAMGEVGALSESDVNRYVQNPAVADKVAGEVLKLSKGTLLPKNAKYLKESLQAISAIAADREAFLKGKFVKQVARNLSIDEKEAAYKLGLEGSEAPAAKPVKIQGTEIEAMPGQQVRSKSTGKIMTVQPDGSLK